ncbi:glycosyltransferase [Paenibacillus sp. IB182496]|uniref:Glycosyltransferase n=1 Tax=Paenibacillus sabuli TaxID=2772509 RepID=A0A927GT88_9BACL|nr:glycosyltransferase [Paenibacillus sabuli]MBD2847559.1 glycosyltransferase [Paenibacillus sabuli]
MKPNLTVLMSVYNDSKYLKDSIESILSQSYGDFDFLIFDDASNDGSTDILKYYAKKDKRIQLIINPMRQGLSANLAKGVELIGSTWIARMDSDDIAFKRRLEKQMGFVELNPDVDVFGGYAIDINEFGEKNELRKVPTDHSKIVKLIWTCPIIHPTVLFKRSSIIRAGSYDAKLNRRQDYDLWFRSCAAGLKFANLDVPLIYYRFTEEYYKKNNFKVQLGQAKMGFKGARLVKASPLAYFGITLAFIKGILPSYIRRPVSKLINRVDPRRS